MRRREFVMALGGAATWPLAAGAQQPGLPVVGFLHLASSNAIADRLRAFHHGLEEVGFVEGDNVTIVYRWADSRPERLPELAAELVQRRVAVIVAPASNDVAAAALAATRTIRRARSTAAASCCGKSLRRKGSGTSSEGYHFRTPGD